MGGGDEVYVKDISEADEIEEDVRHLVARVFWRRSGVRDWVSVSHIKISTSSDASTERAAERFLGE